MIDHDDDPTEPQSSRRDESSYRRKPIGPFAIVSSELYANRKIRKAGRNGREVFVFALTRNAARGRTGSVEASELDPDYIADMLQIDRESAAEGLQRAVAAELLAFDGGAVHIVGWDETWARAPMTESERERKRAYRERQSESEKQSQKQSQKQNETQTQTQTQKKRSPGHVRDKSGPGVRVEPAPLTPEEDVAAEQVIISGLGPFGIAHSMPAEREHVAALLRQGHNANDLIKLAHFLGDDGGAGWYEKLDKERRPYMRGNIAALTVWSLKHIAKYQACALGRWDRSWRLERWIEEQRAAAAAEAP